MPQEAHMGFNVYKKIGIMKAPEVQIQCKERPIRGPRHVFDELVFTQGYGCHPTIAPHNFF